MADAHHDLTVIGAGPGGYVAALRAAQLGVDVACVDRNERLGGTCLRVGCIPSKALLESSGRYRSAREDLADHGVETGEIRVELETMMRRKREIVEGLTRGVDGLFQGRGVTRYRGHGRFDGSGRLVVEGDDGRAEIESDAVIVATGSVPAELPGVELDGDRIGTSTAALEYPEVPDRLAVIGAGYIGLELGSVWRRLGAEVVVFEALDRVLPNMDGELARRARGLLEDQGLEFRLGAAVTGARVDGSECVLEVEGEDPYRADRTLLAVGRRPNTEGLGLESVGIEPDDHGFLPVDEDFHTAAAGVYAIGDVIGGTMLAHEAEEEGIACVEKLYAGYGHVEYGAIPAVVYTEPEIASVGRTEEELEETGVEYRKGSFPFRANARARCLGETEGFVKVLAAARGDRLLGVHILGPRAGALIAEAAVAMQFGASSEDLARTCHAHPTLSEALREAALAVDDRSLHA